MTHSTGQAVPAETGKEIGIEVTPKMIEAGARLIAECFYDVINVDSTLAQELAKEVYSAMASCRVKTGGIFD